MMNRRLSICINLLLVCLLPWSAFAQENESGGDQASIAFQKAVKNLNDFNSKHSRFFEGGSIPLHYLEWTDEGTPLILLHGTYSTAHDFVRFAPKLVEAGYRPISVDWYGHGKTPIPNQAVTASDFVKDLRLLLDSLDIEKAVLAGHSRGGMLAGEFYKNCPDRTQGLVLIDGGSTCIAKYFASLGEEGLSEWMDAGFDQDGKPLAPSYESLEELFSATWTRFGQPENPVEMYDVISQSAQNDAGRWTRWRQPLREWLQQDNRENTFNGMLNPSNAPPFFSSTVLFEPLTAFANLDVPILILDAKGNNELYRDTTLAEENEQLKRLHPELVTHIEMPTGHFVHRELPEEFVGHLRDFYQRVR